MTEVDRLRERIDRAQVSGQRSISITLEQARRLLREINSNQREQTDPETIIIRGEPF